MSRMHRFDWLSRQRTRHSGRSPFARRLRVEPLEDRRMLAVITVTSLADNLFPGGGVTLREAIFAANIDSSVDGSVAGSGADTIDFSAALSGDTITLGGADLIITEALTIDATSLAANVTIDANNASRIFNITATTGDFTLAGLTLIGGRTTGDNAIVADTTFSGGAVRSRTTGNLTIDQSNISGNSTTGDYADGGGIFSSGTVTLTSSTVSGNSTATRAALGGGIYSAVAVTLTSSTVSGNSTAGSFARGGGIYSSGTVTLIGSTVSGNSTTGNYTDGGGIYSSGTVTLTSSTVSGNSTTGGFAQGGGIYSSGDVTLTSSTVSGNSTAGNVADGGGIFSFGDVTLTSSTVTDNHASYSNATGGGIWNDNDPITITNSIVAGNTAGGGMNDINPGTGTLNVDFSLIGTGVNPNSGVSFTKTDDPMLGPLASNGGLTKTHALLPDSLAIDAGDPSIVFNPAEFDQRGAPFVRVFDDPDELGTGIDMGAYERQTVAGLNLVVDTSVDENDGDYSGGDLSLREAIGLANGSIGAETITFDATLFATPQTILLTHGEIELTEAATIDATAVATVTIDAQQQSRIFNIVASTGDFTIAGLTLTGGRTTAASSLGRGGAIRSNTTGDVTIDRSTVRGNSTEGFNADGGGIFPAGAVMLTSSTFSGNSTTGTSADGGGIFSLGAVTLDESTVSGNSTAGDLADGGGIFSYGAVTLTSSTVSGNSTTGNNAVGGGILARDSITLNQSTVTDNHAIFSNATGGGIWNDDNTITITNSIVAGNTAGDGMDDINPGTGALNVDFSLIEQTGLALMGGGNITGFPANLGPLAGNGGPTKTHALLPTDDPPTDPIDNGDPSITFNPAEFDQRGAPFVRVADGGINGLRIDMGAYERQTVAGLNLVVDTTLDEYDGDFTAGDLSLREAVGLASGSIGADVITFDATVFAAPQTILLTEGQIDITDAATIDATTVAGPLTIDAQQQSRIFNITAATGDSTIAGLTLTGGRTVADGTTLDGILKRGGAIRSLADGNLTLDRSTVSGNSTAGSFAYGGGIFSIGSVTLTSSTISGNSTAGQLAEGGGIRSYGDVTLTSSTVSGNSIAGVGRGGGIYASGDVTLTDSTVSGNSTAGNYSRGGGIYVSYASYVTITDSTISGNFTTGADAHGGGIAVRNVDTTSITGSTIMDNSTMGNNANGGGFYGLNSADTTTITDSQITGNNTTGFNASGGGIFSTGDLTLADSTVSGNSTGGINAYGGGIYAAGDVTVTRSTVSGNSTTDVSSHGGGILARGNTTLTDSTVSDNFTTANQSDGGGIFVGNSAAATLTVTRSTVSGNSTTGSVADGAGIYSFGDVVLTQSTVSGNTTTGFDADGPGIFSRRNVTVTLSTITDNHGSDFQATGGGIWNSSNFGDTVEITGSIVAGNTGGTPTGSPDLRLLGSGMLSVNYTLIGDTSGLNSQQLFDINNGMGNILNTDPMLGPLSAGGGPTETHALLAGSQAIDMGDPSFTPPPDFDQRGAPFARVFGGRIDIGALEVQPIASSADFDSDGDRDGRDFLFWQRGFGTPMPNATKSDGDADNDLDVDGDDLDIWEGQFGLAAPVVAAGSALNSASPTSGDLVDLALAVAFAEKANDAFGAREVAAHSPQPGFVSRPEPYALASGNATSQLENNMPEASAYGSDDDRESPEDSSPWEYALDEVFASAFD